MKWGPYPPSARWAARLWSARPCWLRAAWWSGCLGPDRSTCLWLVPHEGPWWWCWARNCRRHSERASTICWTRLRPVHRIKSRLPYLCVWSSNAQSFKFSSTSPAFRLRSSTVASQLPGPSKAALTTSNCCRPNSWMNSCCTMSSCGESSGRPRSAEGRFTTCRPLMVLTYAVEKLVPLEGEELQVTWIPIQHQGFGAWVHHQICPDSFPCDGTRSNQKVCYYILSLIMKKCPAKFPLQVKQIHICCVWSRV